MYRIVHNKRSGRFRVERQRLLGWTFVDDPQSGSYLEFGELEAARDWICAHTSDDDSYRRWEVVTDCTS